MSKFTLKTAPIRIDEEQEFFVGPLSFNHIVLLADAHRNALETAFDRFSGRDPQTITENEAVDAVMSILREVPPLAAHIVALGADDERNWQDYMRLPAGVQLNAIIKIGEMTFASDGGPKKFVDLVLNAVRTGTGAISSPLT